MLLVVCSTRAVELEPIPVPDWTRLDPSVVRALEPLQSALDAELRSPTSARRLTVLMGEAAKHYHSYALLDSAEACYVNAARLAPDDLRWPYLLARLYGDSKTRADHLERAAALYQTSLRIQPTHVPSLLGLGSVRLEQGEWSAARTVLEQVLTLEPLNASARLGLGRIALEQGEPEAALVHLQIALEQQPDAGRIRYALAMTYRALGDTEQARTHLAVKKPHAVRIYDPLMAEVESLRTGAPLEIARGIALRRADRFEDAARSFRRATELDPGNGSAYTNLGATLLVLERYGDAIDALIRSLEIEPDNPVARYNLALAYSLSGDDVVAVANLERAVEIHPQYARAHRQLGDALARLGEYGRAVQHYSNALSLGPADPVTSERRIMMLVRLERHADALAAARRARTAFPAESVFANIEARLLASSPDDTVRDGETALRIAIDLTRDASHMRTIAMAQAEAGDYEGAVATQRGALEMLSGQAVVRREAMQRELEQYRSRRPNRTPWSADDPVFHPPVI